MNEVFLLTFGLDSKLCEEEKVYKSLFGFDGVEFCRFVFCAYCTNL